MEELTGEYRIVVYREKHLDKFDVEVEKKTKIEISDENLSDKLTSNLKSRLGVRPRIKILPDGTLERATHKATRVIDKREKVWAE